MTTTAPPAKTAAKPQLKPEDFLESYKKAFPGLLEAMGEVD